MQFYAGFSQTIKALSDEDLSPEAVLGLRRQSWNIFKDESKGCND